MPFPDIIGLCREAGNPDMVFEYASTSKITFPGAGISVMAASEANQKYMQKLQGVQMISYDKVNQLRHVKYLKNKEGKRLKNSPQSLNSLWINIKKSNLDIVGITEEERERLRKNIF